MKRWIVAIVDIVDSLLRQRRSNKQSLDQPVVIVGGCSSVRTARGALRATLQQISQATEPQAFLRLGRKRWHLCLRLDVTESVQAPPALGESGRVVELTHRLELALNLVDFCARSRSSIVAEAYRRDRDTLGNQRR